MIITFCGNKDIFCEKSVLDSLLSELDRLFFNADSLVPKQTLTFYCGCYGDFDHLASRAIDLTRKKYPNIKTEKVFVTPYITDSYKNRLKYYKDDFDEIIYPPLEKVPLKLAIPKRNEWMITQSDLVIIYCYYTYGNTAKMLNFARRKHKNIILLNI